MYLHPRHPVAVLGPDPRLPVDAVGVARVRPPEVAAVQVGGVAGVIPPGPLELRGAAGGALVVVAVFGGEGVISVVRQGITCSGRGAGGVGCHWS